MGETGRERKQEREFDSSNTHTTWPKKAQHDATAAARTTTSPIMIVVIHNSGQTATSTPRDSSS